MLKVLLYVAIVLAGIHYSLDFIFTEKFQKWSDEKKYPWTCKANLVLSEFHYALSHYQDVQSLSRRTMKRCPKTDYAQKALFNLGKSHDAGGQKKIALSIFYQYQELYPQSKRIPMINKKIERLENAS